MSRERAASAGLRVVLVGATGALGREVLAELEQASLPVAELVPVATVQSIGSEIDFRDLLLSVESELPSLATVDLLILCTPAAVAREMIREALRAQVACIDCSGVLLASSQVPTASEEVPTAFEEVPTASEEVPTASREVPTASREVPLVISDLCAASDAMRPVIVTPAGVAMSWALALSALQREVGLERVVGTVLQPATHAGRAGIDVLSSETIALLSQSEPPEPELFPNPVAFDCLPATGALDEDSGGATLFESRLRADLARLLGPELEVAVTAVQVPTFVGEGSALAIQTQRKLSVEDAMAALEKAPGVELWSRAERSPSTRDASGSPRVLVGRVRRDPSHERGLLLWLAADGLRLVASNVAKLAETRLRLN